MTARTLRPLLAAALAAAGLGAALAARAQTRQDVTATARVESRGKIEMSASVITFIRTDPTAALWLTQSEPPVQVTLKATTRPSDKMYLRIVTPGDLVAEISGATIAAENVRWEASGGQFQAGTLSKAAPQLVATVNQSGVISGLLTFYLANDQSYTPGVYHMTVQLTLSAF